MPTKVSLARVTVDEVRELLELIASATPHRVDPCVAEGLPPRYVVDDRPHCLVARVLAELDFDIDDLRALDEEHPTGDPVNTGAKVAESTNAKLRRLEPAARALLQFVQERQDRGVAWGKAVRAAVRRPRFGFLLARIERFKIIDRERRPWLYR